MATNFVVLDLKETKGTEKMENQLDEMLLLAARATRNVQALSIEQINALLLAVANQADKETEMLLTANAKDLSRMDSTDPKYDRLKLTAERIHGITNDMRNVAGLHSPVGSIIESHEAPAGFQLVRKRVPFGVVGVIYEARPNVSFDIFSLCAKTNNVCLLKGGTDALDSNTAIVELIRKVAHRKGIDPNIVQLLPAEREITKQLLEAVGKVDLVIPRGSGRLIRFVRDNAKVPIIETGAGICHTYIDKSASTEMARDIVENAKTRRVSVCNALDCMLIHREKVEDLPLICAPLLAKGVTIYADRRSYDALKDNYINTDQEHPLLVHASPEHYGTEFLSLRMAIKVVDSLDEALIHIAVNSSKHSECIVTEDLSAAKRFQLEVDAACVYHNVSTAFTDGAQFGLGAEIGISTQKLHARGPMALQELCTYKWLVTGTGQTRRE